MISAIFEILGLLAVALLIGVYFTRRYWKAKYDESITDLFDARKQLETANQQRSEAERTLSEAEQKATALEDDKKALQEQLKTAEKNLSQSKSESEKIAAVEEKEKAQLKKVKSETKGHKEEIKGLYDQIEELQEEIAAQDRELAQVQQELAQRKISYYKQIDGKRYKAQTLMMADESVAGKGDGRISKADAEKIFATISDGKSYTQVEKDTMRYLRDNYRWTEEADALFRTKVRSWAAKGHEVE